VPIETLCQSVERVSVQTLVVNTPNLKNDSEVARLGQENMRIDKPNQDSAARLNEPVSPVILEDSLKPKTL